MMILKIDEKAYEYLDSKSKTITIDLLISADCCGGTAVKPLSRFKTSLVWNEEHREVFMP